MSAGQRRHLAGHATYRGRVHVVGRIFGPTTYGGMVIATEAIYDEATDRTRVEFRHATEADLGGRR